MWWLLLFMLLLGLLFWLPVSVEIDSAKQVYRMHWQGIFSAWAVPEEEGWSWYLQVFFWKKVWRATDAKPQKEKSLPKKSPPAVRVRRKPVFSIKRGVAIFKNMLKAISMEHLRINWDTGDFVLNAWLYPAFRAASCGRRQMFINFRGEQELAIRLQTRPGHLLWAVIRAFFTIKK